MPDQTKKIAVAYCRVSTDEQADNGLSLDVQEASCTNEIAKDGLELLKVVRDEGKSAGTLNRPGIKEIMELAREGKINAVYAVHSDRMNRNAYDHLLLRKLFEDKDVTVKYLNQPNLDKSAASKTMDTMMAAVNEMQRLMTSDKVKDTLYAKAKAGYFPEKAPIGYKNVANPDPTAQRLAKRILAPDEMAPYVAEAFKLYSTGNYNAYDLNDILYERGLRTKLGGKLASSRLYQMLANKIYVGEFSWGPVLCKEAKHAPLIDHQTFDLVQTVMSGHNRNACRRRKYKWLLNGFIYCPEHKCRYTADWHIKSSHENSIAYYHCKNRYGCGKYVQAIKLEGMIAEEFKPLEFKREFVNLVLDRVKGIFAKRRSDYTAKRQGIINERTALEARMKSAQDRLLDNTLSSQEFTQIKNGLNEKLDYAQARLKDMDDKQEVNVDVIQEVVRLTENIYATYMTAPYELKRHYLSFFWERFEVKDGVIIKSCLSPLFKSLLELQQAFYKTKNPKSLGDSAGIITKSWSG